METRKPIKRSKELIPLSREHHEALLLCWKIRTGIANGTSFPRIKDYILWFYNTQLRQHLETEEQHLFVLLPANSPLIRRALSQHEELRALIASMNNDETDLETVIHSFGTALDAHIRFEERELFQIIELETDTAALALAAQQFSSYKPESAHGWKDLFWVK